MVYVGIDCATDLIRVALPAQDKFLLFQPLSLLSNLSFTILRSWDLLLDKKQGDTKIGGALRE